MFRLNSHFNLLPLTNFVPTSRSIEDHVPTQLAFQPHNPPYSWIISNSKEKEEVFFTLNGMLLPNHTIGVKPDNPRLLPTLPIAWPWRFRTGWRKGYHSNWYPPLNIARQIRWANDLALLYSNLSIGTIATMDCWPLAQKGELPTDTTWLHSRPCSVQNTELAIYPVCRRRLTVGIADTAHHCPPSNHRDSR